MAEAGARSRVGVSKTMVDAALIAEIAPPMLDKLKNDARLLGLLCAAFVIIGMPNLELLEPLKAAIASAVHLGADGSRRVEDFGLAFGFLASFTIVPWYFQWRAIKGELKYRRQHGKWRWER